MKPEHIEDLVERYLKEDSVISVGTDNSSEDFLDKIAKKRDEFHLDLKMIPTSTTIAEKAQKLGFELVSANDYEVDLGIEFVDLVDKDFNYIKKDSTSLVRDKMIAQSSNVLVVIVNRSNFVKQFSQPRIPFEVTTFGWRRTLIQLESLGHAELREKVDGKPYKTETGHYLIDVDIDDYTALEDLEFQAKDIPGVLETGLFIGYADKVILRNGYLEVKTRIGFK